MTAAAARSVDEVLDLLERFGKDPYDEVVSQLDHALQTAGHARSDGADDFLIAAALLHDVGHLLDLAGMLERNDQVGQVDPVDPNGSATMIDLRHENSGSKYLAGIFPPAVTGPVALHVRAKRYLCAKDPGYVDGLSSGSIASLARQGGPMDDAEVAAFERNPSADSAVRLRRWDDLGKVYGLEISPLAEYRELLLSVATS
ncbi:MAG TPA: inositol oxygenase family protein [Microthrixaceae bacterium]|nr:inositol oxygenase family protein [Microthrixaceae bacterium]